MEKLSKAEMRAVTGKSGFINSEADRKKLRAAQNQFESLIESEGLENFLPDHTRHKLLERNNLKPEKRARLLERTTRNLLKNPEFLKQIERTGRALVQLSKALRQLRNLR